MTAFRNGDKTQIRFHKSAILRVWPAEGAGTSQIIILMRRRELIIFLSIKYENKNMAKLVRGSRDIFEPQSKNFTELENCARGVLSLHGFGKLSLPTVGLKELFIKLPMRRQPPCKRTVAKNLGRLELVFVRSVDYNIK